MPSFSFPSFVKKTMSTSWQYGDVSPARYPDLESKRKRRGAASSVNHGGGKKKKESKKKETMTVPSSSSSSTETHGAIQQMVPVGLDAFATAQVPRPTTPYEEELIQGNPSSEGNRCTSSSQTRGSRARPSPVRARKKESGRRPSDQGRAVCRWKKSRMAQLLTFLFCKKRERQILCVNIKEPCDH